YRRDGPGGPAGDADALWDAREDGDGRLLDCYSDQTAAADGSLRRLPGFHICRRSESSRRAGAALPAEDIRREPGSFSPAPAHTSRACRLNSSRIRLLVHIE